MTEEKTPTAPEASKSIFTAIVQMFSLATAAAFIVSAIANSIVFKIWGLDYLQIASFPDVIMSGLSIALYIFIFITIMSWHLSISALLSKLDPIPESSGQDRIFHKTYASLRAEAISNYYLIGMLFLIVLIFFVLTGVYDHFLVSIDPNSTNFRWYSFIFLFAAAIPITILCTKITRLLRLPRLLIATHDHILAIPALILVIILTICDVMISGYVSDHYRISVPEGKPCPEARVVWIGESSVVGQCEGSMVILKGTENRTMTVRGANLFSRK